MIPRIDTRLHASLWLLHLIEPGEHPLKHAWPKGKGTPRERGSRRPLGHERGQVIDAYRRKLAASAL